MYRDTRHLTVALDHIRPACGEIAIALAVTEESMAQQAARRALDHLTLAARHLEHEEYARHELADAVRAAREHARKATQAVHDALNDWDLCRTTALNQAQEEAMSAIGDLSRALVIAPNEAVHA